MGATPTTTETQRRTLLNLRVRERDRDLIDRAATASGKNRSEFMLEAAREAAEDVLLDRTDFRLDNERLNAFIALLDAPPKPNEKLRELLATPAPWDR